MKKGTDLFSLDGKVALVTGACYGIGFAVAKALADAGAKIAFNSRHEDAVARAAEDYAAAGIDAFGVVADVTDEDDANRLVGAVAEKLGEIDILVNNAGIIKRIPMHEMSADEFREVVDIDLVGPFIMSKAVLPSMMRRGGGKIINICSMMSEFGRETVSAYASAKGGLKMLTRNIASEYGEYNIQCNGIGPGYIATPQTAPLRERQPNGERHPFDSFIVSKTPAGRWGTPDDLMGAAIFLASPASDFVNGQILYVDGGISAYIGKQPK
ncbi:MAG: gluconate 5-dehydrogenase [Clostridia bacterium]|nr:gluconate 5-dehydrogenase [Clostridia bacterium]